MMHSIGIVSIGEMGASVASLLRRGGLEVRSALADRSQATRQRASRAGVEDVGGLEALVERVEVFLSIVPPAAATGLADRVAATLERTGSRLVYVDANAISPLTARRIGDRIERAGSSFVDGGIIGPAGRIGRGSTLYLSGESASEVAALARTGLDIEVIGHQAGQASSFKMLWAGMTKGLSALAIELLTTAEAYGLLEPLVAKYGRDMAGVATTVEGLLPRVPRRAGRRSQEMTELAEMMRAVGVEGRMALAAGEVLAAVAAQEIGRTYGQEDESGWSAADVARILRIGQQAAS